MDSGHAPVAGAFELAGMRAARMLALAVLLLTGSGDIVARTVLPPTEPPVEYVMATLQRHPVVILGEGHWIRHDVRLVADLVPRLAQRRVVLAMETLVASDQQTIDRILAAPEWLAAEAMSVMRSAKWPYREYHDILRVAWEANRKAPGSARIVALGPPHDWRARGVSYEKFMADRVAELIDGGNRVLVYCGIHHGFTRYHQPELDLQGRARAFIDRMGNILRRRYGEGVFLVTLHRPVWCGEEPWSYCLPLGGALDCAASGIGHPIGFDVAGTPIGDQVVDPAVYYARGYPTLRLGEMTDGYIWFGPIDSFEDVQVIPLEEFAPDAAAIGELAAANPFSDEHGASPEHLAELWREERERRADPQRHRRWEHLLGWRDQCASGDR